MHLFTVPLALALGFVPLTNSMHPICDIFGQIAEAQMSCERINYNQSEEFSGIAAGAGCPWKWDGMICWPAAAVGEVVNRTCPSFLDPLLAQKGLLYRNCTEQGWSNFTPAFRVACEFENNSQGTDVSTKSYYLAIKQVYTVGYVTSLIALVTAIIIFTAFRKFHCTRNYIHMNLFVSFILRATSVFTKDAILYSDASANHCFMSTVTCKAVTVFLHYCVLANCSWLLVEGLYLQTLLSLTFVSNRKYFWWYCVIGWGAPIIVLAIWSVLKLSFENSGCWDGNENQYIWWIIRGAILLEVLVNFLIFLNVIRILMQKLRSPDVGGKSSTHFSRLMKSTLLLIPLFGIHYIVCAFFPDNTAFDVRMHIELGIGSFQGFAVALLYCFLNGEVLAELSRRVRWWRSKRYLHFSRRPDRTLSTESSANTYVTQMFEKFSPKRKSLDQQSSLQPA